MCTDACIDTLSCCCALALRKSRYIILNTAVQAHPMPPSSPDHYPVQHVIDWVRVWEWVAHDKPGLDRGVAMNS